VSHKKYTYKYKIKTPDDVFLENEFRSIKKVINEECFVYNYGDELYDDYRKANWVPNGFKIGRQELILLSMADVRDNVPFEEVTCCDIKCDLEVIYKARLVILFNNGRLKILKNINGPKGTFFLWKF